MRKPELLAPAGDLEKLKIAVTYGADAVYLAGKQFGLRAFAGNFTKEEMAEGIKFAHEQGAKVYITANIIPHNDDLVTLPDYLEELQEMGADAIIAADPGVISIARKATPNLSVHLSTQANTTNWVSAGFWAELGVSRVVLARELSLTEINEIRKQVAMELEVFVHGAMCISYSGRCLLSSFMTGRHANLGQCAQPCRWKYALVEEKRPGQFFPIEEDERGSYIFNSHDLCMIEHIPELINSGVDCLKIEGRMKSVHYVATIVRAYRQAIDAYMAKPGQYTVNPEWLEEISKVSHRAYTTGFYFGRPAAEGQTYGSSSYLRDYDFVALVRNYDSATGIATVEQRNKFALGDLVEITGPNTGTFEQVISALWNEEGEKTDSAPHPQQVLRIKVAQPVHPFDLIRREKTVGEEED